MTIFFNCLPTALLIFTSAVEISMKLKRFMLQKQKELQAARDWIAFEFFKC